MISLALYAKSDREYVVIITDPDATPEDFCRPGYELVEVVELPTLDSMDITAFPCDRELFAND